MKVWRRNPQFDLYSTTWLPASDRTGEHIALTKISADGKTTKKTVEKKTGGEKTAEKS